jgi:hypothetical protein
MRTAPSPPAVGNVSDCGETVNWQAGLAGWVTVTVVPATVSVPVRAAPLLAATV